MQPVTVAISPTGIEYLLRTLLGDQIAKALETHMTVPDYSLPVDAFIVSAGNTDTTYEDISIQLSGGALVNFAPTFKT
jgi:hypothetical protein